MRHPYALAALTLVALLSAMPAHAQWKWRDADGRVNYSDRPPPPGVTASQLTLLDRSGAPRPAPGGAQADPGAASANARGAAESGADAGSRSWADRAIEMRRRQAEREAADRKALEQEQAAASLARFCDNARADLRTLESGMRVARVGNDGEREFIEDDEREKRIELLRREVRAQCPSS